MLAEKSNELGLARQDNGRVHGRRSPERRRGTRRSSSVSLVDLETTHNPPLGLPGGRPPPPPPPPPRGSLPHQPPPPNSFPQQPPPGARSLYPPNSLLGQIAPNNSLQNLFVQNWNNTRIAEPYMWRDRLRITGRRKSESSLDHHRREVANSPSVYHNLPPDISKRKMLASWRRRVPDAVQTNESIFAHEHIPNQSFPDLTAELSRAAERSFGLDLYGDNPQSLFISYLLDSIEFLRYERNFMESLLTQPIIRPAPPAPPPPPFAPSPEEAPVKNIPRRQVLHRVLCVARYHDHGRDVCYEDKPVKKFSEKSGDQELEGEIVVTHLGRYCVQNPDIAFIIFQEHQCVQGERPAKRKLASRLESGGAGITIFEVKESLSSLAQISPRAERMVIPPGLLQKAIVQIALCDPPRPSRQNDVTGVDEKMIDMDGPYLFLYHHRAAIRELTEQASDPTTEHISVLLDFLNSHWEAEYREANNQFDSGIVTNKHIDKLFCPNDIVIQKNTETVRAYVIANWPVRPQEKFLAIPCWSWMYNGVTLQRNHTVIRIPLPLPDSSTIIGLPVCPISKTDKTIIEELRIRGKKFWSMKERYFGCYSGFDIKKANKHVGQPFITTYALIYTANAPMQQHTRVVIDIQTYSRMHPEDHNRDTLVTKRSASRVSQWPVSIPWEDELDDLTVILLPTVVHGFWLQEKTWCA